MKISYKVIQQYIPDAKSVEEIAQDLVMHTAEVEEVIYEGEHLKDVIIGKVLETRKHPEADKLNICRVEVCGEEKQIVCGAPNVRAGLIVPVAKIGAQLKADFVIQKTKIRGETSEGMICSEDELGLMDERQDGIMELPQNAPLGMSMRDYLGKNDAILEIDNKAINHRPDLFSNIGIIREMCAIAGKKFDFEYITKDFSTLPNLGIKNMIPETVRRYIGIQVNNVANIPSPDYILQILNSFGVSSKGLLIDVSNYSLYLYGQPTHCFDADKVEGSITVRFAKNGETFTSLKDVEYTLSSEDIVIADDKKILALGGIIGGKSSAVNDSTKNIIIEAAHFDQAIIRKTGKKLGLRTDALNVFEKDILPEMNLCGASLIVAELEKYFPALTLAAYSDIYTKKQEKISIPFDKKYIHSLIGKEYPEKEMLTILENLGIILQKDNTLLVPKWRKDLNYKSDIAEEIARIDGYENIAPTLPKVQVGAIIQSSMYKLKNDARKYFCDQGFFDMYTYSFVNESLMKKLLGNTSHCVEMKNALTEEMTHLRPSLIPHLLMACESNKHDFEELKLFEFEKVFQVQEKNVSENYMITGIIAQESKNLYYEIQNYISNFFKALQIDKIIFDTFENKEDMPSFAHNGRTAKIIVKGKEIGVIGEIKPKVADNFGIHSRIGFFEINANILENLMYSIPKYKEISEFQANSFDLSFVVDKTTKGKDIALTIEKTNTQLIKKVELFDIFESEEILPGKRSLSFTIFMQSMDSTLDDNIKNNLIKEIVEKVAKKGGKLR